MFDNSVFLLEQNIFCSLDYMYVICQLPNLWRVSRSVNSLAKKLGLLIEGIEVSFRNNPLKF